MESADLFEDVCSVDFLGFQFGGRSYQDQLYDSISKTKSLAGVAVRLRTIEAFGGSIQVVWVYHNFSFLGGSLGSAEGEKITRAFEYGVENNLPVVVQCKSGGARMQVF
jgi:acetyl-CoA carboxylase beta subunit